MSSAPTPPPTPEIGPDAAPKASSDTSAATLPASRVDWAGRRRVDLAAFLTLAWPLVLNNTLQAVLGLTDTWFISRISPTATAGVGAIHWLLLAITLVVGGVAMCVQTFAAQEHGAGDHPAAGRSAWAGVWASAATLPLFILLAFAAPLLLSPFGLPQPVAAAADEYWLPRMLGQPLGLALWAVLGFFNGIGETRRTLLVTGITMVANAALNPLLMFTFGLGIAGSAWATNLAQALGLALALAWLLGDRYENRYRTRSGWRPHLAALKRHFTVGLPMGFVAGADLLGASLFTLFITRTGEVGGAATQVAFMLTSLAYLPGLGLASAGTTLVGQAIGAGHPDWAERLGTLTIRITAGYMGTVGVLTAILGPWLMPAFVNADSPNAAEVIALGTKVLWLAAIYQTFDGFNFGSSFCLRGAGDARVPAILVAIISWGLWVPATHMLTFAPGEGLVTFLPAFGLGTMGAWYSIVGYIVVLGGAMYWRWRSGAWRKIKL